MGMSLVWMFCILLNGVSAQFGYGGYGGYGGFGGFGRRNGGFGGFGGRRGIFGGYGGSLFGGHSSSIISVSSGSYVAGGVPAFVRIRNLQECQKYCDLQGSCQAGDYNAYHRRCYLHTSATACNGMSSQAGTTHFKKITCTAPSVSFATAANSMVFAGKFVSGGLNVGGKVKSLKDCIKHCDQVNSGVQKCFALDYNLTDKSCYIHTTAANVCPFAAMAPVTNRLDKPDNTHIALCP